MKQWLKFAFVGALGTGTNAIFFTAFSLFDTFKYAPLEFLGFPELTLAWGFAILVAMVGNFFLNKKWVFGGDK